MNKCFKNDIWSVGIVSYLLLHRTLPFHGETTQQLEDQILNKNLNFNLSSSDNNSTEMKKIV